jgi:prefoldin subunit 5
VLELLSSFRHLSANIVFLDIMNPIQTLKKKNDALKKQIRELTNNFKMMQDKMAIKHGSATMPNANDV